MMQNMSEVAQLKQRLIDEYEAGKRGLEGFAETARHEFIRQKTENMSRCHTQLVALVGEARAGQILVEIGL